MIRIAVVDDHPLVREGIEAVLGCQPDMEIVGYAGSLQEARKLIATKNPDMVLLDLKIGDEHGLDLVKDIRARNHECAIVVLTAFFDGQDIKRAMDLNIKGFLLKEALPEEMVAAVRIVSKGRLYIDPDIMEEILNKKKDHGLDQLTPREVDVLKAVAKGMNNREIASNLFVTESTVKKHISQILSKLELKDRTQAALFAIKNGIVHL